MLVSMTLPQGHSGSPKAKIQCWIISATKQAKSIKRYNGRPFFLTWSWLWKRLYGLPILVCYFIKTHKKVNMRLQKNSSHLCLFLTACFLFPSVNNFLSPMEFMLYIYLVTVSVACRQFFELFVGDSGLCCVPCCTCDVILATVIPFPSWFTEDVKKRERGVITAMLWGTHNLTWTDEN